MAGAQFCHVVADFLGVPAAQLKDATLLNGLLIAAAGAAGFPGVERPIVRQHPSDGVTGVYVVDGCHITLHAFPGRELLLLDVLAEGVRGGRTVVEVFARRLAAREVRSAEQLRG